MAGLRLFALAALAASSSNFVGLAVFDHCSADLNGDGFADLVLQVGTPDGFETIALLRMPGRYEAHFLARRSSRLELTCRLGEVVHAFPGTVPEGDARTRKTPGAFVLLSQPEGSSAAYIWNGTSFDEFWVAD